MVSAGVTQLPPLVGVSTGGSSGQVLTKGSTTAYDFGWASPTSVSSAPIWVSGNYYDSRPGPGVAGGTCQVAVGRVMYVPAFLPAPVSINTLATYAPAAAGTGASAYLAVYSPTVGGFPATRLATTAALSTVGAGVITGATTAPATLPSGWVLFAFGAVGLSFSPVAALTADYNDFPAPPLTNYVPAISNPTCYFETVSGGVPPPTAPTSFSNVITAPPVMWFKVA